MHYAGYVPGEPIADKPFSVVSDRIIAGAHDATTAKLINDAGVHLKK